ncbi:MULTISPECIES: WD40 repeat domain-containing protein [unclassified Mycolicibacterium]|uniref:WD40 repeat domain-containing protein n=1 Tax=unclassified Mycolicibacterium TaxID=2636767 RepID=UPI002EDABB3F
MNTTVLPAHSWRINVDDAVAALSAAPDGRVAVAGAEGSLVLVSAQGAIERRRDLSRGCLAAHWSPAGDRIAVGSIHGVDILDAEGTVLCSRRKGWCASVAWSADGSRLAAAVGSAVMILDAEGNELFSAERDSTVTAVAWVNRRVATAAYGGVHVYHASPTAAPDILPFTGSLLALAISPDRRWAASGNQDATLHVWRIGRGGDELEMSGYPTKISTLEFSPDSALLASGGGQDVTVWDFTGPGPRGRTPRILRAHDATVTALAWSPRGDLLAAAAGDGQVALWEPRRGRPGRPLAAQDILSEQAPATAISWDATGRLLAGWSDATVVAHMPARLRS